MTGPPDRRIVTGLRSVDTKIRPTAHFPGVSMGQFTGVIVPNEVWTKRRELEKRKPRKGRGTNYSGFTRGDTALGVLD